eukprot:COSAG03_NODE_24135_length_274_cov_1.154286_2_plen_30_part_01
MTCYTIPRARLHVPGHSLLLTHTYAGKSWS